MHLKVIEFHDIRMCHDLSGTYFKKLINEKCWIEIRKKTLLLFLRNSEASRDLLSKLLMIPGFISALICECAVISSHNCHCFKNIYWARILLLIYQTQLYFAIRECVPVSAIVIICLLRFYLMHPCSSMKQTLSPCRVIDVEANTSKKLLCTEV